VSPFYGRLPNVPGFGADTTAEEVGLAVVGGVAALSVAHGAGKLIQHQVSHRRGGGEAAAAPPPGATAPPAERAPADTPEHGGPNA
jgi:hypothetical protein